MPTDQDTEQSAFRQLVTSLFLQFCHLKDLTILHAPIDNHGSYVWEAGKSSDIYRVVHLAVTPVARQTSTTLPSTPETRLPTNGPGSAIAPTQEALVEVSYGAEDDTHWVRRLYVSWYYIPEDSSSGSTGYDDKPRFSGRAAAAELEHDLETAWEQANLLTANTLQESHSVSR